MAANPKNEQKIVEIITEEFQEMFDENEFITDWQIVIGTRKIDGGGGTYFYTNGAPKWAQEGMLRRGLKMIDLEGN